MSETDLFKSDDEIDEICRNFLTPCKKQADAQNDPDIIPETPCASVKKKKRQKEKGTKKGTKQTSPNKYEKWKIHTTQTGTFDFNRPYVYHSIKEVLDYSEKCFPKNNNIHLIGVYLFDDKIGNCLGSFPEKGALIALDFTVSASIPLEENVVISVFGSIEIIKAMSRFVVSFFRQEVEINVYKYIENLRILRNLVPMNYLTTISTSV